MAEIAGPSLRSTSFLLNHSFKSFLSFRSLPSLLLSAFLVLTFRSLVYSAALRLVLLVESDEPFLQGRLTGSASVAFPSPPPPLGHFYRINSLEPDTVFSSGAKVSSPSNLSFYYQVSGYNYVKIPVPTLVSSPFFFTAPPEDKSSKSRGSKKPSVAFFLGAIVLGCLGYLFTLWVFIMLCSSVSGVVFYSVISIEYFKRPLVPLQLFLSGSSIGIERLSEFMFVNWFLKESILHMLTMCFMISTIEEEDEVLLLKIFFSSKLMSLGPISLLSPLSYSSSDYSLSSFFFAWTFIDSVYSVVFTIPPWIQLMENHDKRKDKCEFTEGIFLLSLMPDQALQIKCIETVFCGNFVMSLMVKIGGRFFGGFVCGIVEIYFMVVWLNFYLSVRCKEAELEGKRFEFKDLEHSLDYVKVKS